MASPAAARRGRRSRRRLLQGTQLRHAALPGETERSLLLRLGQGKHRPLRDADRAAPRTGPDLGRARLRDRLRAGRCSPTAAAGCSRRCWPPPASSTRSPASPSSSCCCRSPASAATRRSSPSPPTRCRSSTATRCVGLANVPGSVKDAARGMGLTERQILWRVELPLATPEIIAGLRIADGQHGRDRDPGRLHRRRRPRHPDRTAAATSPSRPASSSPAAIAILMALALRPDPARRSSAWPPPGDGRRRRDRASSPSPARLHRGRDRIHLHAADLERHRRQAGRRLRPGDGTGAEPARGDGPRPGAGAGRRPARSASTSGTAGRANCSRSGSATPAGRSPSWP